MSAAAETEKSPPQPDSPPSVAHRGDTVIADRVVERLAQRVVQEVGYVGGARRRVLGVPVSGDSDAQVSATVDRDVVTMSISLAVRYPSPLGTVADYIRAGVRARVHEFTGLDVRHVDIEVVRLTPQRSTRRRVESG